MPKFTMKVIQEPEHGTRSVIKPDTSVKPPILVGDGPTDYLCGNCGATVVSGMREPLGAVVHFPKGTYRISDRLKIHAGNTVFSSEGGPLVIRCTNCDSFNELPQQFD